MADNDNQVIYKLDLDATGFQNSLNQANEKLGSLEKTAKLATLPLLFANAQIAVQGFKLALDVAHKAMDLVFEGEAVRQVNLQFEQLTKNAGIATDTLRDGLKEAAGGLVDDTDLLKIANESIITMGNSAKRLPELMELARKSTAIMGGDLKQNFEDISWAINVGNTRLLKNKGIILESDKVYKDYAHSIGLSSKQLSDQGEKQALLNAAITFGNTKLKDVDLTVTATKDSWTRLKNVVNESVEAFSLVISKALGPTFKAAFDSASHAVEGLTDRFKMIFSSEASEQASATIKIYEQRLLDLKEKLTETKAKGNEGTLFGFLFGDKPMEEQINEIEQEMMSVQGVLDLQREKLKKDSGGSDSAGPDKSSGDQEKILASRTKFESDLLAIKKSRVEQELKVVTDQEQAELLIKEKKSLLDQEEALKIGSINEQLKNGDISSKEQAEAMKLEIERNYSAQRLELRNNEERIRLQTYQNEVAASDTAAKGMAAGFKQGSAQAQADLNNFGAQGQRVFKNVSQSSVNALIEIGKGQKTASEIAKGFIFGMLADEAQARGQLMLLASIFPPNPAGLAAGAGLLVLSGFLRSQGGGGSAGGGVSGAGDVGSIGGDGPTSGSASPNAQQFEQNKKAVTIQVQGSYFETEQTKQRLLEMIRDQTDATDFKYVQVGRN